MPTYRATSQNPTTNLASQPTGNLNASLLDTMWQTLWNVLNDSSNGFVVLATDTGTVNNYVVTNLSPALAYRQGMLQAFMTANVNTAAAQINIDGLGNVAITTGAGAALVGGELSASGVNVLIYDGTKFRIFFTNLSGPFIIGDTATQPTYPGSAILVPRYKLHPDQIWTYGTFDDHFDTPASGTPNVKWVRTFDAGGTNVVYTQASSKLCLGMCSPANTTTFYNNFVTQQLPVQTTHQISLGFKVTGLPWWISGVTYDLASAFFRLEYATGSGLQIDLQFQQSGAYNDNSIAITGGASFGTTFCTFFPACFPNYFRITYDSSKNTQIEMSADALTWMGILYTGPLTGAQTGFATTAPKQWVIGVRSQTCSPILLQVDWIKHV